MGESVVFLGHYPEDTVRKIEQPDSEGTSPIKPSSSIYPMRNITKGKD